MVVLHALLALLLGCWGDHAWILEGTVLEVHGGDEVVLDHKAVPGLMGAMTMPFRLKDPSLAAGLRPGDQVVARLMVEDGRSWLEKIRVTGHVPLPEADGAGPAPVHAGDVLPRTEVPVTGGGTWVVGEGQDKPTVLTFLYTTCPIPEFCPMLASRLAALQAEVGTDARLLAVTIDPDDDTLDVLQAYGERVGADAATWRFGRLEGPAFQDLVARAALPLVPGKDEVVHGLRLLVLDKDGRLVERYDDNHWPLPRVLQQLRTGGPPAPPGSDGTLTP